MCHAKNNAFLSICKACNDELKLIDPSNLAELARVIRKHGDNAKLLGFSVIAMKVEIGRINGVLHRR